MASPTRFVAGGFSEVLLGVCDWVTAACTAAFDTGVDVGAGVTDTGATLVDALILVTPLLLPVPVLACCARAVTAMPAVIVTKVNARASVREGVRVCIRFPLRFTQADQGHTRSGAAALAEEAGWLLASTSGVSKNRPPSDVRRGSMACTVCWLPLPELA